MAQLPIRTEVWAADYHGRLEAAKREDMERTDSAQPFSVIRLKSSGRLTPAGIIGLTVALYHRRFEWQESFPVLASAGAHMAAFLLRAAGQSFPVERTACFWHGSELLRFAGHPFWRPLARRFFAEAAGFAVASEFVRELAWKSGLLPTSAQICLAPCAVPTAYQQAGGQAGNSDAGVIRILTVARLHPRKGQVEVARALALLPAEQRGRLVYLLVGSGDESYRRQIEGVCREAGIVCEFRADVADELLPEIYGSCTIYVQASRTLVRSVEGFGISLLEAGFFGCPIVAFRSGGVEEAVVEGRSALLVDEGDVVGCSAAIGTLIASPDLCRSLGETGAQYARTFSWERSARTLCAFVKDVQPRSSLAGPRSRATPHLPA